MKLPITTFAYVFLIFAASATQHIVLTKLDESLASDDRQASVRLYMKKHSLDSMQMMKLLDANIEEQRSFTDIPGMRDVAMFGTMISMTYTDVDESLPRLLKYSGQDYPEAVRADAVSLYIQHADDAGFVLATNVMTQAWRSSSEHNRIRMGYYTKAKVASPENKGAYIELLKWAAAYDRSGGFKTWDRQLNELDPSWRTDQMRRAAVEAQKLMPTTTIGTNILEDILRDYEIASGLREPEPPPAVQQSSEDVVAESGKTTPPQGTPDTATQPTENEAPRSRTAPAIGVGVLVILAALGLWKLRRR